jgi:ABC-2 type transport system ATP-binding protein
LPSGALAEPSKLLPDAPPDDPAASSWYAARIEVRWDSGHGFQGRETSVTLRFTCDRKAAEPAYLGADDAISAGRLPRLWLSAAGPLSWHDRQTGAAVNVIEIRGLHKIYRRLRGGSTKALDGLDLTVERGGVFGFLGPNGSGKTTTIRFLLALSRPTTGSCNVLGEDSQKALHEVIARVGSIVEAPALFPNFSGRRNLELLGRLNGISGKRIDEVMELVGLRERSKHTVKTYSLGMRQRLAIAAALLKDPELLILDEPANGLDPAGIREVRQLLKRLGKEGRTVFVSSHILSEVQQMCDRVAILAKGRCVASGRVEDVLAHGRASAMLVTIDDLTRGAAVLAADGIPTTIVDGRLRAEVGPTEGARISRVLASHELYPSELRPDDVDLETVFLQLTDSPPEEAA